MGAAVKRGCNSSVRRAGEMIVKRALYRLSFENDKRALRPNQPGQSEAAMGQQRSELSLGTLPAAEAVKHVEILEVGGQIITRVVGKHALNEQ